MSTPLPMRGRAVRVGLLFLVLVAGIFWYLSAAKPRGEGKDVQRRYPQLFPISQTCPPGPHVEARARRFERHAELYSQRYPYDPADGVRAVLHFRRAASCYSRAGKANDAARLERSGRRLSSLIETDYASARIALAKTLASGSWSSALGETRRLLRLTQHLAPTPYVSWLEATLGKVASRADRAR